MRQSVFRAQSGDGGAEAIDDRQAARNSQQVRKPGKGAFAGRAQSGTHGGLSRRLAGSAAPQPRGHTLEAGFAHEVTHAFAGDDQFATFAIDMAEHRFGGGNAVQPDRALGKLHVHGPSPLKPQRSTLSTD